jgi:hypothetical protein
LSTLVGKQKTKLFKAWFWKLSFSHLAEQAGFEPAVGY